MGILGTLLLSCSSDHIKSSTIRTADIESTELNTRGNNTKKDAPKACCYNKLGSFSIIDKFFRVHVKEMSSDSTTFNKNLATD
jgi:hypothetical protein